MDNSQLEASILEASIELLTLKEEQIRLATLGRFDDQLEQIRLIQDQQAEQQRVLDQLMLSFGFFVPFSKPTQSILSSIYSKISSYNGQLELIIKRWYSEDSGVMKQIRNQRTTLQAYGGVNQVDIISYYIDDKK